MLKRKLSVFVLLLTLALSSLGLSGCRQDDAGGTPTPAALVTPQKQLIPMLGGDSSATSPLPTPGASASPLAP